MESHDALLEVARTETGLDDFGNDSFLEGLEILVRALQEEASLNEIGDGALIPAKVLEAPWLTRLLPRGDDATFVFESELGVTRIEGETVFSTFEMGIPEYPQFPILFQGGVRYRWDGEETYGMLERSSRREKIAWD
jgi:hypothetical protein